MLIRDRSQGWGKVSQAAEAFIGLADAVFHLMSVHRFFETPPEQAAPQIQGINCAHVRNFSIAKRDLDENEPRLSVGSIG